ncbi:tail assembly chaperone [Gordonia phage Puppers]|nr:tail assembly chaperone [Gordonia phage Puppers]
MSNDYDGPRRYAEDVDLDAADIPVARPRPVDVAEYPSASHTHSIGADPEASYEAGVYDHAEPAPVREVGATRPRPQDHLPPAEPELDHTPVYNEALGILVVPVHFDGMALEVPADPEDWPVKATLAFEDGKVVNACRHLLSAEDFDKVMAKNYRNKKFGELFNALAKAGGFANSGN